jgi:predicted acylesterase/phospholipase RssA/CRP-like cAMP-binding protein
MGSPTEADEVREAAFAACLVFKRDEKYTLDEGTLAALAKIAATLSFASGAEIVAWGRGSDAVHIVAEGEVILTRGVRADGPPSTHVLRRGGMYGEGGASQESPRHFAVRATCKTTVIALPYEGLRPLLRASSRLHELLSEFARVRDHEHEIVSALRRSDLAGAAHMRRLRQHFDEVDIEHFEKGHTLVKQGERSFGTFYLLSGTLESVRHEGGAAHVVDTVHAGEILCDYALLHNIPEPLDLRALTHVAIVRIPRVVAGPSLSAARGDAAALTVKVRALVGPPRPDPNPSLSRIGALLVDQLRGRYNDAVTLLRLTFDEPFDASSNRADPADRPTLTLSLPRGREAGAELQRALARYNRALAVALLDTSDLTDEQAGWIAPHVRSVVQLQSQPDEEVRFTRLRGLPTTRVGLVDGGSGRGPWAPAALRLPRDYVVAPRDRRDVAEAVERIGRAMTKRRVGVALGGGGAWGYAHVSLLQRMHASRVPVDVVAGCSFGAVVGAYYAALGPERFDKVKRDGPALSSAVSWSILSSTAVSREVKKLIGAHRIESLLLPYFPVATEVASGTQYTLRSGPLEDGVRASGAFPGMFTPVTSASGRLVDGGIINNVPEDVPEGEGSQLVVASNIVSSPPTERLRAPRFGGPRGRLLHEFNPISRVRDVVRSMLVLMHSAGARDAHLADVTFAPPVPDVLPWDFGKPDEVIDHAAPSLEKTLVEIKARWDELARPITPERTEHKPHDDA